MEENETMIIEDNVYVRNCNLFLSEIEEQFPKEDIGYVITYISWNLLIEAKMNNYILTDEKNCFRLIGNEFFLVTILKDKPENIFNYCLEITKNYNVVDDYIYLTYITLIAAIKYMKHSFENEDNFFENFKEIHSINDSQTVYEMLQYL